MIYADFLQAVCAQMKKYVGEEAQVKIKQVTKNNGVVLDGLVILKDDRNYSPAIYLNDFYNTYENNSYSIEEIASKIYDIYMEHADVLRLPEGFFTDFDTVKDNITCRLINYEQNTELLSEVPHRRFLDLALVYYVVFTSDTDINATITIRNEHMMMWKMSEAELYKLAISNMEKVSPPLIKNINELLCDILAEHGADPSEMDSLDESYPMYVITNASRNFGAVYMMNTELLEDFAVKYGPLYVIPSSVHEVIIISQKDTPCKEYLYEIVKEVNHTQLTRSEVLSDSVYSFRLPDGYVEE